MDVWDALSPTRMTQQHAPAPEHAGVTSATDEGEYDPFYQQVSHLKVWGRPQRATAAKHSQLLLLLLWHTPSRARISFAVTWTST